MSSMAKGVSLGMTTVAVAVVFLVAFLWVGPGQDALLATQPASALFDEELVEGIYERVSPAVVEVDTGNGIGVDLVPLGKGSGFLIDADGHIVTNNHVVEGAGNVTVTFSNGISAEASILGRDIANDLALLKVDPSVVEGIEPVVLGDSSALRPGQLAIAIGNPFGLEGSITVGVVSQVGRSLPTDLRRPISGVVQTDALINPGNSGGPLLDSSGAVIGINTAIQVSQTGGVQRGIGFAVPVDTLKRDLPRLMVEAIVRPPWLGIEAVGLDASLAERLGLSVDSGVYIVGVVPESPADDAGLVESGVDSRRGPAAGGDIISAVDGNAISSVGDLVEQLNASAPGDQVTLTVVRGSESLDIEVTLAEWRDDLNQRVERRFESIPPDGEDREFPSDRFRRFFCHPNDDDNGDDDKSQCERFRQFSPPFGNGNGEFPRDFFERFFERRSGK